MTHWAPSTEALNWRCSTGSAMLTTVPSTKAMLEPMIVAASTHGSSRREQCMPAPLRAGTSIAQG